MKVNKTKYYSWSRYWSNGEMHHVFECPNHKGYTYDLNSAGVFDDGHHEVLLNKEHIQRAKTEQDNRCYYIPVDKVDMLGRIQKTVVN